MIYLIFLQNLDGYSQFARIAQSYLYYLIHTIRLSLSLSLYFYLSISLLKS